METNDAGAQSATSPMPKFNFEVDLGTELRAVPFQEVSGLEAESQVIEYRNGNSPLFSTQKMPGIAKYGNVTLKRGVFVNDDAFAKWYSKIMMNTITKQTILIKLLDETGKITMQWQLNNAFPTKLTSTDLKSDGNEIAIDTLEIAHEQLIMLNNL
jgi:phage tail-like protein